jgi:hypothetical protein
MAKLVQIDDTNIAEFPDDMPDAEIERILSQQSQPQALVNAIPSTPTQPGIAQAPQIDNPDWLTTFAQGAAALPITAGLARGLAWSLRGRKGGQAAQGISTALMPQTGRQWVAEGVVGGTAAVAGSEMGKQFPEGWQRDIAGTLTGMAVGYPFAISKNVNTFLNAGLQDTGQAGVAAAQGLGSVRANQMAKTAVEANPGLVPSLVRASEIEKTLGADLPTLAAANGDTTISGYMQSQIAKGENAAFTAAMKQQYEAAEAALTKAQNGLAPSMKAVEAYVRRKAVAEEVKAGAANKAAQIAAAKREEGLFKINERIQEIGAATFHNVKSGEDIGQTTRNLINSRRQAVQDTLSPKYEAVLNEAEKEGVKLSGEAATGLREFVKNKKTDEVFQSFPKLYGKIQSVFAPKQKAATGPTASKYMFAKPDGVAEDVSVRDVDSLKREINLQLRRVKPDSDQYRFLSELKDKLDESLDTMPAKFRDAYRAVDDEYFEKIGVPYRNAQGVLKIDRAKFEQQVTPSLTKNPESLREALTAMNNTKEAHQVATDAFMLDLSKNRSVYKADGTINPVMLTRYIRENKASIDQVQGLRQQLESVASDVSVLAKNRNRILDIQKGTQQQEVETLWSAAYGTNNGFTGLVRNALSNPRELEKLMAVTSNDKVARESVKAAMIEDLVKAPGDRMELFSKHSGVLTKVFGKEDTQKIMDLVEASQRIRDNPLAFKINTNLTDRTKFEKALGSKAEQTVSELRNPVLGQFRTMANHVSRFFQNTASKSEAQEVQRFLTNYKAIPDFAAAVQEYSTKGVTDRALKLMTKVLGNYSVVMAGGGAAGFVGAQNVEDPEAVGFTPSDPKLLEGFVGDPKR